jgi:16S rRNA (guanine527-N7)-methyltransferase
VSTKKNGEGRRDWTIVRQCLTEGLEALQIPLDRQAVDRLLLYYAELMKWNRTINLVGAASPAGTVELHFLDSLALTPTLRSFGWPGPLLDIGSGAGFPGLVLKAAFPELAIHLVEPRQKRAVFLRHIIRTLGLSNSIVHSQHLRENDLIQRQQLGLFPAITSRALTDLRQFLRLAASFCQRGGYVLCMKGKSASEELAGFRNDPIFRNFRLVHQRHYLLPFSKADRTILVFQSL